MNLISCNQCGTVLDKDKLHFPDISKEDGTIDTTVATWINDRFVSTVSCPVCNANIYEEDND